VVGEEHTSKPCNYILKISNQQTPRCRAFLEQLTLISTGQEIFYFYETEKLITMLIKNGWTHSESIY
jgi:hypothetical protein